MKQNEFVAEILRQHGDKIEALEYETASRRDGDEIVKLSFIDGRKLDLKLKPGGDYAYLAGKVNALLKEAEEKQPGWKEKIDKMLSSTDGLWPKGFNFQAPTGTANAFNNDLLS